MFQRCVRTPVGVAVLLLVLGIPAVGFAQQANVSVRVAPFGVRTSVPLFSVDIVEPATRSGRALPSLTVVNTSDGPQLTNLAFALPELTIGHTAVTSRLGDQKLPRTFLSSPLSGASVQWPMRGVSLSTAGAAPMTLSVGRLDAGYNASMLSAPPPSVMALAVSLSPTEKVSVAPRVLVPMGSGDSWNSSIGTAVRAEVLPHVSVVSDVGAADGPGSTWAPLASAGVIGQWGGTEIETSVLRGAPASGTDPGTVGSLDRELARVRVQALPGLTVAGGTSRSRPADRADAPDTTLGSIGFVYKTESYGQVTATQERQLSVDTALDTTRLEWRHPSLRGIAVRYTERRGLPESTSITAPPPTLVEIDLPALAPQQFGSRLRVQAGLRAAPGSAQPPLTSRFSGRLAVVERLALAGETELELASREGGQLLRAMRLTTEVGVLRATTLQLRYTYRSDVELTLPQAFEARISRTIQLSAW